MAPDMYLTKMIYTFSLRRRLDPSDPKYYVLSYFTSFFDLEDFLVTPQAIESPDF